MSENKGSNSSVMILGGLLVIALAAGAFYYFNTQNPAEIGAPAAQEQDMADATPLVVDDTLAADVTVDVAYALSTRSLGNPSAPVKVKEFSSLTCSHCGDFHRTTMPTLKSKYIDTGKLFVEFVDFPLNAPALHASMIARCLPENRYFDYIQLLFETQDKWAFNNADYAKYIKQNAQLAGISGDLAQACMNSEELQAGLLQKTQEAQTINKIESTPTFVFANGAIIAGAQPIESFDKVMEEALATSAAAPAAGDEAAPNDYESDEDEAPRHVGPPGDGASEAEEE